MAGSNRRVSSLQDLADIAGVSRATVSRALSDSPLINEKTKEKLKALAAKHNYTINRQARDFRLRKSSVISVVFMLDKRSDQHMSDPFFLEMLGGIADRLADRDYDLLLAHAPIEDIRGLTDSRIVRHADGVIFIGQGEEHDALNGLVDAGARIVVWGGPVADKQYPLIGTDNFSGAFEATSHLLRLGHQRIAFFGNRRTPENIARFSGYVRAMEASGYVANPNLIVDVPSDMHRAKSAIPEALAGGAAPHAILCTSDVMAIATISALSEAGYRVPEQVSVVGFDDIQLARFSSPPLTTVRQDIRRAGNVLVDTILSLINGEPAEDTLLPATLVERGTTMSRLPQSAIEPPGSR